MNQLSAPPARKPKDRDFVETLEGLLFCLVGYQHPPDKYIAYLKYSPAPSGPWQRRGVAYHRELVFYHAHQVALTIAELEQQYPPYVHDSTVWDMRFSMVPHDRVRAYYVPETRLAQIMAKPMDELEEATVKVIEEIRRGASIPLSALGVTGSILLGIHSPAFSDIDLTVYGRRNVQRLRDVMNDLALAGASPMDAAYVDEWCRGVVKHHALTYAQAHWLISRRWNFVYFGEARHTISLHPTRADDEITETYGEHFYRDIGVARIAATLTDTRDAIYLPAIYQVASVDILEGPQVAISEICAYEGLFAQIGEIGQRVEARGKLERVDHGPFHRLVVGSSHPSGVEYLLPVEILSP